MLTYETARSLVSTYYKNYTRGELATRRMRHVDYTRKLSEAFGAQPVELPTPAMVDTWVELAGANPWISNACDPVFDAESFYHCNTVDELAMLIADGNWSLGQAFTLGNLAFIQQVNAGDEWLAIKGITVFDSMSLARMLESGSFYEVIARVQAASEAQCKSLDY